MALSSIKYLLWLKDARVFYSGKYYEHLKLGVINTGY